MTNPIPDHLRKYSWYAPHQAWLRDRRLPHHDPGDALSVRADLDGARLDGADLYDAILDRASLDGASLRGADLHYANLYEASLRGARLDRASLAGAHLDGASLRGARLDGVTGLPDLRRPGLAAAVLRQITEHPETWDQSQWHCNTRHCVAGWVCALAEVPQETEQRLGTAHAAKLALGLQLSEPAPFGPYDKPIPWLRELAAKEETRQ